VVSAFVGSFFFDAIVANAHRAQACGVPFERGAIAAARSIDAFSAIRTALRE
jgi:hypothetical protein